MIAYSLVPNRFEDGRHVSAEKGLAAVGFRIIHGYPKAVGEIAKDDVVIAWNAYGTSGRWVDIFEGIGARGLVMEEAYIREIGGEKYFALARGGHNGSGRMIDHGPDRWASWSIEIKPWCEDGNHVLVCGQRGFGYNAMAMSNDWQDQILPRLRALTPRPIWFRPHPKRRARMPGPGYDRVLDFNEPLAEHLSGAWAVVVWTSNCATQALLNGIPAFFDGPHIVTQGATERGIEGIERPRRRDREPAFHRLAWAQWSMREIESGEAFRAVLR